MHPRLNYLRSVINEEIATRQKFLQDLEQFSKKFGPILDDPEFIAAVKNPDTIGQQHYGETIYFDLTSSDALRVVVKHLHVPIHKSFSKYGGNFYALLGKEDAGMRVFFAFEQPHCKVTKIEKKRFVDDSEYVVVCSQADGTESDFVGETIEPDATA